MLGSPREMQPHVSLPPCSPCFPTLKCFSPTAGHTVVETLCLRRDSGTDFTSCWTCCASLYTGSPNCRLVFLFILRLHSLFEACAHAFLIKNEVFVWHLAHVLLCCASVRRHVTLSYRAITVLCCSRLDFLFGGGTFSLASVLLFSPVSVAHS